MKKMFLIILMLICATNSFALGANDWVYLKDFDVDLPIQVAGTYMEGSNVTEPKPRKSKYLQVEYGGMVVIDRGAGFFLSVRLLTKPSSEYYITVEYPNPVNPDEPFINDVPYNSQLDYFNLSSPDVISGLIGYDDYNIKINIYADKESMESIDSLTQTIRVYVDTQEKDARIFKKVLNTILK